jgi:2-methylcitrate dehydratase PrpD
LDLVLKHDIDWQDVERVVDHTYSGAINLCGGVKLVNTYAAKWHIPFCVATALRYRRVSLESFTEARLKEEALLDLAGKVRLQLDPDLDALYPAQWPSRLEIDLRGGDRISTTVYTPKGDPDNPIRKGELEAKFRDNATVSLDPERVEALIESIDHLEDWKNVGTLLKRMPLKG